MGINRLAGQVQPVVRMRRHLIGITAAGLLVSSFALTWRAEPGPMARDFEAAAFRIGILMGVIWLAYHQLLRIPVWLWYVIPPLVAVLALRPRLLLVLLPFVPVLIFLSMLWPRPKAKGSKRKVRARLRNEQGDG